MAEIGQNHQGSVEAAKDMCEMAANPKRHDMYGGEVPGADAVKLTKRDLSHELTRPAMERPYRGRQSFGDTYLKHRKALELSWPEIAEVYDHAKGLGLGVGITLCAPTLVDEVPREFDWLKVASRDLTNLPLLRALAATGKDVVISTGMAGPRELDAALSVLDGCDVTVLHCVSSYPTDPEDAHLRAIRWLKRNYPEYRIGYSDHTKGLVAPVMAVAYGATWIEKHASLWRGMRGSDHAGAMGPEGWWYLSRNVRQAEAMRGELGMPVPDSVEPARQKLERSLAFASDLSEGTVLGTSNLELLSPGTGLSWMEREKLVGKQLCEDVEAQTLASSTMVRG